MYILSAELQRTLVKFKGLEIMLFTNRAYTKHQDQESFRKSGFFYSALHSPIQYCVVTASDIEISSLLNRNPLTQQKIKDSLCNRFEFINNLLWSLIFINRIDVFLKFSKTDKVEQLGERSASQAHANLIFG